MGVFAIFFKHSYLNQLLKIQPKKKKKNEINNKHDDDDDDMRIDHKKMNIIFTKI